MTKQFLPVIDAARTEFGFARTICSCPECTLNCQHIPGYLIPADLDRIKEHLAPDEEFFDWAKKNLLASPGAVVLKNGKKFRIPTLVPARKQGDGCIFLTEDDRCRIHPVAPYGCAFFDSHQPAGEADRRSIHGLQAILTAWANGDLYAQVWLALDDAGISAPSPESSRRQLRRAWDEQKHS